MGRTSPSNPVCSDAQVTMTVFPVCRTMGVCWKRCHRTQTATSRETIGEKQIQAIFLFRFKMGHKATETTHNINKASGPGTNNERTVKQWFKKFCNGDGSLEDEEQSG